MHVVKVIGFQQFTSSQLASAVGVSSTLLKDSQGNKANGAFFSATTSTARYRDDGTAPTASVGMSVPSGLPPFLYQGDLDKLLFIGIGGNQTVDATYVQLAD
jgi:hypothetical protein